MLIAERVLLFIIFILMAFYALIDPAPGIRMMAAEREAEKKRRMADRAGAVPRS